MRLKTLAALVIIGSALIAGLFIIGKNAPRVAEMSLNEERSRPAAPKSLLVEALPVPTLSSLPESATAELKNEPNPENPDNATKNLAQKIAAQILKDNPEGPLLSDGRTGIAALRPEELVDKVLSEAIGNFDYAALKPEVKIASLKIRRENTGEALAAYLNEFQKLLKENSEVVDSLNPGFGPGEFSRLSQIFEVAIAKLYALTVPSALAPLHAEEISLMSAQKNIWNALAEALDDPVGSFLALQALDAVQAELENLKKSFTDFIAKNNLNGNL